MNGPPNESGAWSEAPRDRKGNSTSSRILPFPASARQRRTPIEIRLEVLSMIARELRRLQDEEQRRGQFSPSLSLALDWLVLLDEWETAV